MVGNAVQLTALTFNATAAYTEDIGNSFGRNGFTAGSTRRSSSSKNPRSYSMNETSQILSLTSRIPTS